MMVRSLEQQRVLASRIRYRNDERLIRAAVELLRNELVRLLGGTELLRGQLIPRHAVVLLVWLSPAVVAYALGM